MKGIGDDVVLEEYVLGTKKLEVAPPGGVKDIAPQDNVAGRSIGVKLQGTMPGPGDGIACKENVTGVAHPRHVEAASPHDAVAHENMMARIDVHRHATRGRILHQHIVNLDVV